MDAEQLRFLQPRAFDVIAYFPDQAANGVDESNDFARRAVRAGVFVGAQAMAQIPGLSDVKHALAFTAHDINARARRNRLEKRFAEPFQQGPGGIEQMQLLLRHGWIKTEILWFGNDD